MDTSKFKRMVRIGRHKIIICLQNSQLSLPVEKLFIYICKEIQTFSINAIFRAGTEFEYSYLLK